MQTSGYRFSLQTRSIRADLYDRYGGELELAKFFFYIISYKIMLEKKKEKKSKECRRDFRNLFSIFILGRLMHTENR